MERTTSTAPVSAAETAAPNHILVSHGTPFFAKGTMHAVYGRVKSGKTTFLCSVAAAALGYKGLPFASANPNLKVVFLSADCGNTIQIINKIDSIADYSLVKKEVEEDGTERIFIPNLSVGKISGIDYSRISHVVKREQADLLIIDDFDHLPDDICDVDCVQEAVDTMRRIALRNNCAVLICTQNYESENKPKGSVGKYFEEERNLRSLDHFVVNPDGDDRLKTVVIHTSAESGFIEDIHIDLLARKFYN